MSSPGLCVQRRGEGPSAGHCGFTLIELMVSTSLAMALATIATTSFYQFSKMVGRAEARLAMVAAAQHTFALFDRSMSSLQQTGAFVAHADGGGHIVLCFLRAKDEAFDFERPSGNGAGAIVSNDLIWEMWEYDQSTGQLRVGGNTSSVIANAPGRTFRSGSFTPAGVNYNGRTFINLPKPRRTLDATDPFRAFPGGLDDNIMFPNSATPPVSLANARDDIGDYSDLLRNLRPAMTGVTDLSWELLQHDGSSLVLDPATAVTRVFDGVWLDGRMASSLDAASIYANSAIAKRPRLLRLRLTMLDRRSKVQSTFSFSFALPGMGPTP